MMWVWINSMPVMITLSCSKEGDGEATTSMIVLLVLLIVSVVTETVADLQKFYFKQENKGKWCDVGLWKFSRHMNYFCEIMNWVFIFLLSLEGKYSSDTNPSFFFLSSSLSPSVCLSSDRHCVSFVYRSLFVPLPLSLSLIFVSSVAFRERNSSRGKSLGQEVQGQRRVLAVQAKDVHPHPHAPDLLRAPSPVDQVLPLPGVPLDHRYTPNPNLNPNLEGLILSCVFVATSKSALLASLIEEGEEGETKQAQE